MEFALSILLSHKNSLLSDEFAEILFTHLTLNEEVNVIWKESIELFLYDSLQWLSGNIYSLQTY